jgi:formylmethanofuran dehydrogenase subunit E
METKELMEKAVRFHGHICPGLAMGVLAAKYLLDNGFKYAHDEELVAVVENDNCSVDALQAILGTTYGKGNLIHNDYGKNNFNFYDRNTKKAIKLVLKGEIFTDKKLSRDEKVQRLLNSKATDIFNIYNIEFNPPELAETIESVPCEICGELTMSSRLVSYTNRDICIPCYKSLRK